MKGWNSTDAAQDGIALLNIIKQIMGGVEQHIHPPLALAVSHRSLHTLVQKNDQSNADYAKIFGALYTVMLSQGGFIGVPISFIQANLGDTDYHLASADEISAAEEASREEYLTCLMLTGASNDRFGPLKAKLRNSQILGRNEYPKTREELLGILTNFCSETKASGGPHHKADDSRLAFAQRGDKSGGGTKKSQSDRGGSGGKGANGKRMNQQGKSACFNCKSEDHWSWECPHHTAEKRAELKAINASKHGNGQVQAQVIGEIFSGNPTSKIEAALDARISAYASSKIEAALDARISASLQSGISLLATAPPICPEKKARGGLLKSRVYLDSCATFNQMVDRQTLTNVYESDDHLVAHCNSGTTTTNLKGAFGKLDCWLNEDWIANLLSVPELKKLGYRITYDSVDGFTQVTPPGASHDGPRTIRFHEDEKGLPFIDIDRDAVVFSQTMVDTVRGNMEGFTKKEKIKAKLAYEARGMVGHMSERDFDFLVSNQKLDNMPFTFTDLQNSKRMFGPSLAAVRGKTVRVAPERVVTDLVAIPRDFMLLHKNVVLVCDIMFVNNVAFLITMSRGIKFITVECLTSRSAKHIAYSLKNVMKLYGRNGQNVQTILTDMEFTSVIDPLLGKTVVNTTAAREHVAEIERSIRTVKERSRAVISTLPFKILPKLVVSNVIKYAVFWLNAFPSKNGVSDTLSPREIVVRSKIDFKKHARVPFGSYCEVHDDPDITNTLEARTHPGIALGPSGNLQGSVRFFCLLTGKVLTRRNFTRFPMPDSIIKLVEKWGIKSKKELFGKDLTFRNRNREKYEWDGDGEPADETILEQHEHPEVSAEFPGVTLESDQVSPVPAVEELHHDPNALLAAAAASSMVPGVDATVSWADIVINRHSGAHHDAPTTPEMHALRYRQK